jgi:pimeloyl-ACP methyl ester carboxylesterase
VTVRAVPWALRVAIVLVAACSLLIGLLWVFQRRLIYLPDKSAVPPAASVLPGGRDITLHTDDGLDLAAWFVPASRASCNPTVLVAGGNAGHRGLRAPLAAALHAAGLGVLLLDYRGYGGNPGAPSEQGLAADVRAAHRFLTVDEAIPADQLLYFGESLGAAVVTELAAEHPPAALVLRSPFRDLAAVAQEHFPFLPVRWLLRDRFPVADTVAAVRVPTLVIYGSADTVVPPEQSRAVADGAGGPVEILVLPGADHNDRILLDGPELIGAVTSLAERVSCAPAS